MENEQVLSLDLEDDEYLYRIQRGQRVVYVSVQATDIIPKDDRTNSARILARLRRLAVWNGHWETLTIKKTPEGTVFTENEIRPHRVTVYPVTVNPGQYYNIWNLVRVGRISDRLSRVILDKVTCILKIARFAHEIRFLERELKAYAALSHHGYSLSPRFLGYVYEESADRVIGFLIEDLGGRHPTTEDLPICKRAVQRLHSLGVVHGDLNKHNMIVIGESVKFLDFEASTLRHEKSFTYARILEAKEFALNLSDDSGIGYRGQ